MKSILFLLIVACGGLIPLACNNNYLGNPHRHALEPKTVPAIASDLRMEPPNWWTGMMHNRVEIMMCRDSLAAYAVHLGKVKGVELEKVEKGDSPNYLFLTLRIAADAPPQKVPLLFTHSRTNARIACEFPLLKRNAAAKGQGVDARDVIYLIFPDRFANGDPANDWMPEMRDTAGRYTRDGRHGGDLKGIQDHLDYLQDLGVTAIWLNPELENNQSRTSYHGYAITDLYRVDPRLGTNEQYRNLVRECHNRGIKVIRDAVPNHIGNMHWWMQDLPFSDWVNTWSVKTHTSSRTPVLLDPYASQWDQKRFSDGWFSPFMPDLNQRNPHLANYLIQQAIWWVEYAGLDAFRIDTYSYCDQEFMRKWCKALRTEYPAIHLFGEIWEHSVITQGFFAAGQPMRRANFDSNMPGVIDFQLCFAIQEALTHEQNRTEGVSRLYYVLAQDYFYQDPWKNVVMLDNHDMTRFYDVVGQDFNKFKTGLVFLLTTRGIPQLYYGTEILQTGLKKNGDDDLRKEFPGGWPGDPENKFTASGRTMQEQAAFQLVRNLIRYRNATPALQTGRLMQFVPEKGVYTFFRYDASKTVMVVLNTAAGTSRVDTRRFAERMQGFTRAKNILTGELYTDLSELVLPGYAPLVLELLP